MTGKSPDYRFGCEETKQYANNTDAVRGYYAALRRLFAVRLDNVGDAVALQATLCADSSRFATARAAA